MQLRIKTVGEHASMLSHLLAKNPHNLYERHEKGACVRLVYSAYSETEAEVILYVIPDPIDLVKGNSNRYEIASYINDREFVTSSLFCTYIRPALGTALNGKPKADYEKWVSYLFSLEISFGPVASDLPDSAVSQLFSAVGYEVMIERGEIAYPFHVKSNSSVRFLTLRGEQTIQTALRQLFILIPVLDNYKHYFLGEDERDKLVRYGAGWLDTHPLKKLIVSRTLRFRELIQQYEQSQMQTENQREEDGTRAEATQEIEDEEDVHDREQEEAESLWVAEREKSPKSNRPKIRLNELRYQAILQTVSSLHAKQTIVDFGSGEGKLALRLEWIPGVKEILAVEPSAVAQTRALERLAKLEGRSGITLPTLVTGSLYYFDELLRGKDVMILCEVIEHIDEHRLPTIMETIFTEYEPGVLIVTTPNKEYNKLYEMENEQLRHNDHRFEWTRAEFEKWCEALQALYAYDFSLRGIGELSETYGQPTQMAVFTKRGRWNAQ